jgi:hypothetical protein
LAASEFGTDLALSSTTLKSLRFHPLVSFPEKSTLSLLAVVHFGRRDRTPGWQIVAAPVRAAHND